MKLSENNKELIAVNETDLIDGAFIIPEGVITAKKENFNNTPTLTQLTFPKGANLERHAFLQSENLTRLIFGNETKIISHAFYNCTGLEQVTFGQNVEILMQGFDNCTNLTQATFNKGAILWQGVFKNCSNLTQVVLGEGAQLHRDAFIDCNTLQAIIINTSNDLEIERVKNSLSAEYSVKVIQNPIYGRVKSIQKDSYQEAFNPIGLSQLIYSSHALKKLPFLLLASTIGYEENVHQHFSEATENLSIPTSLEDLPAYQKEFKRLIPKPHQESAAQWKRLECVDKMQCYYDHLKKLVNAKQCKFPLFFSENNHHSLKIEAKLNAIDKVIEWLKGNTDSNFNQEEITLLYGEKVIASKLNESSIVLPQEDSAAMVLR